MSETDVELLFDADGNEKILGTGSSGRVGLLICKAPSEVLSSFTIFMLPCSRVFSNLTRRCRSSEVLSSTTNLRLKAPNGQCKGQTVAGTTIVTEMVCDESCQQRGWVRFHSCGWSLVLSASGMCVRKDPIAKICIHVSAKGRAVFDLLRDLPAILCKRSHCLSV